MTFCLDTVKAVIKKTKPIIQYLRTSTHLIQIASCFRAFRIFIHFFQVYFRILAVRRKFWAGYATVAFMAKRQLFAFRWIWLNWRLRVILTLKHNFGLFAKEWPHQ